MDTPKTIHTINARGNIFLEVTRDYFGLSAAQMFNEINAMRNDLERKLQAKGIDYSKLRSALVPNQKRKEAAFIFDTTAIESDWYGLEVFERLLPLLDKSANHSILVGDYIVGDGHEAVAMAAMQEACSLVRDVVVQHPSQFYIVYLNNLSNTMILTLIEGLAKYPGYIGFADTTYESKFKTLLSTSLVNLGIKHGQTILQGHEDDRDDSDDVNMCGYPFSHHGYTCRSVSSTLKGILLSYKIERPVYPGFEADTEFALNAISTSPMPLDDFKVEVASAKLRYVLDNKSSLAARAGIDRMTAEELSEAIRQKVRSNYIYSLTLDHSYSLSKFNVMLEFCTTDALKKSRHMASLEYKAPEKVLRLITLY